MAKHKLFITSSGDIFALCNNIIENVKGLGKKEIHRAADVEFNNPSQKWEVITPDSKVLGAFTTRAEAISFEITQMNELLKQKLLTAEK